MIPNLTTTTTPRAYNGHTSIFLPTIATIEDVQTETALEKIFTVRLPGGLGGHKWADRRVLARRLGFNLIGLPPTPEETAAFAQAFADGELILPRGSDKLPPNIRRVGEVNVSTNGAPQAWPLYLAEVELPLGEMLELLAMKGQERAAELKIGPYLDFEFLGRRGRISAQWDGRRIPTGDRSAAHIFGVTLERAPASLYLTQKQPGNVFHGDEVPELGVISVGYLSEISFWERLLMNPNAPRALIASVAMKRARFTQAFVLVFILSSSPSHCRLSVLGSSTLFRTIC